MKQHELNRRYRLFALWCDGVVMVSHLLLAPLEVNNAVGRADEESQGFCPAKKGNSRELIHSGDQKPSNHSAP